MQTEYRGSEGDQISVLDKISSADLKIQVSGRLFVRADVPAIRFGHHPIMPDQRSDTGQYQG